MDTYFCEIWSYFGPHSWLSVQPRLKRCTFVDFLIIEFWKWILVPIWEISMDTYCMRFGVILELFWLSFKVGQTKVENMHFCWLSQNWVLKVDLGTHLRDNHGKPFYEIWSNFGPRSRLVKPWLKISTFVDFLGINFLQWI